MAPDFLGADLRPIGCRSPAALTFPTSNATCARPREVCVKAHLHFLSPCDGTKVPGRILRLQGPQCQISFGPGIVPGNLGPTLHCCPVVLYSARAVADKGYPLQAASGCLTVPKNCIIPKGEAGPAAGEGHGVPGRSQPSAGLLQPQLCPEPCGGRAQESGRTRARTEGVVPVSRCSQPCGGRAQAPGAAHPDPEDVPLPSRCSWPRHSHIRHPASRGKTPVPGVMPCESSRG